MDLSDLEIKKVYACEALCFLLDLPYDASDCVEGI